MCFFNTLSIVSHPVISAWSAGRNIWTKTSAVYCDVVQPVHKDTSVTPDDIVMDLVT